MAADAPSDRADTERLLNFIVDPVWYRARHRDVLAGDLDPLRHFIDSGLRERRDPNRWFDTAWYARQYADVAASGVHPLLHYMAEGAKLGRDPHPRFDAGWYVRQHPESAGNPLLFHLRVGAARGWLTEPSVAIEDWLPSARKSHAAPSAMAVDVIIPVYRDFPLTRRCVESVLADTDRTDGRIIVIDDHSPESKLSAWLRKLARTGAITLSRNKKNLGFVASVNLGIQIAADRDVVLLNSDTEVPSGWLRRLFAQAYAAPKVASISPLSNNATICSYLDYEGGPMPAGMSLLAIDNACRTANAGRFASTPTTVGYCMYIRRAALDDVGLFDTTAFGKGYGEENDFCLRAITSGWQHRIACDTFVWHLGGASFGTGACEGISRAYAILTKRYPDYARRIARYVDKGETEPFRFAATMSLFRASGLPTVLIVSHGLKGGVQRHIHASVARDSRHANHILLEPASRGLALSVPALSGHPKLILAAERWRDVAAVARAAGVTRVHIHHVLGHDLDARALIHDLSVPFDVTVHDYFVICPQITLLPWSAGCYCGEPGPSGCDACIANRPSHGATDILSWRLRFTWLFNEADRIFMPSEDTLDRMRRHGIGQNTRLLPHETVTPGAWTLHPPPGHGMPLRIAVLGVLADHKGAQIVASLAMAAEPAKVEILVIGAIESTFPDVVLRRITVHGPYREGDLPGLLEKYRPHVVWYPATWPETYSYTLSAAMEAGMPIVASQIGAFPERLAGRPLTWLSPPTLDPAVWLALFETIADTLRAHRSRKLAAWQIPVRPNIAEPVCNVTALASNRDAVDLRRDGATAVVVIPETFDDGSYTPCAHIRLLRPIDHPATSTGLAVTVADFSLATRYRADVILTQRHAVPSIAAAEALARHARRTGAKLIFDIDDDLLNLPEDHPDVDKLAPLAPVVKHMIELADIVRVSTQALASRIAPLARQVQVVGNALDERIWLSGERRRNDTHGPVRILCMGTATHNADFAMILPALSEIHRRFGNQMSLDLIGFVSDTRLPPWIRHLAPSPHASRSYPGFVHWLTWAGPWDIGLAPLADTKFNACKSSIKALDYAALGLAILASDVDAYRGSLADGPGGMLVPNTTDAWYEALSRAIRDASWRCRKAAGGEQRLKKTGTLASQANAWRWDAKRAAQNPK
jgi:GT2 family glycosyltransferase/glycosyltransferase involved in cell wall biosynthesis